MQFFYEIKNYLDLPDKIVNKNLIRRVKYSYYLSPEKFI